MILLGTLTAGKARAVGTDWPIVSASASSGTASLVFDNNTDSNWFSAGYDTAQHTESVQIAFSGAHPINYIKFGTMQLAHQAWGFPVEFMVSWFDGVTWRPLQTFTHFPVPTSQWFSLALPDVATATSPPTYAPAQAIGVKVTANVLAPTSPISPVEYAFVLSELRAGYDPDLTDFILPGAAVASSEIAGWPASGVQDGNAATVWSSNLHSSPSATESIYFYYGGTVLREMNAIRLLPRYVNNSALGFPVNFSIAYFNGASWVTIVSYTNFPTPTLGDWLVLPFGKTVFGSALQVTATTLGSDGSSYVFQLAEVQGEFSRSLSSLLWTSNNGATITFDVQNVGSEFIDRLGQISTWRKDIRGREELLPPLNPSVSFGQAAYRNTYAPSAVYLGPNNWDIYFGGWDGQVLATCPNYPGCQGTHDEISTVSTTDNFKSFGPHALAVHRGAFGAVNNECVVRAGPSDWWMVFTAAFTNSAGKVQNGPAYARSTDGMNWTPSSADTPFMLKIAGYPLATADINGTNAIFSDQPGNWHLFFADNINDVPAGWRLHHATSTDGINYTYQGDMPAPNDGDPALQRYFSIQDVRSFIYGGRHFFAASYSDNASASLSVSSSANYFPAQPTTSELQALFPQPATIVPAHVNSDDYIAVTSSIIQDGSRIYGLFYGACSNDSYCVPGLADNRIFARWAQKSVYFQSYPFSMGSVATAFGPDLERIPFPFASPPVQTGRFTVYDTDGTSFLYQSSPVTLRAGDVWTYAPPKAFASCTSNCANKCFGASDGCGAICQFNSCNADYACPGDAAGNCQVSCVPKTCSSAGTVLPAATPVSTAAASTAGTGDFCGTMPDGCGGTLTCTCSGVNTCGGGGVANACGCTPADCPAGACGTFSDGCGGSMQCGCSEGICQANHLCGCPSGQHTCSPGCAAVCP